MRYTEVMALFVQQNDNRSKYQQQIAAELQEKLRSQPQPGAQPDGVEDSAFVRDTKSTTSLAWMWLVIALAFVGALVWLVILAIGAR